jgi:hypothetical protein
VERLGALEEVSGLLVDVDTALAVGDSDVEAQMARVMDALGEVAASADESGQGEAVLSADRARESLAYVADAVARRDYYEARLALQAAAEVVRGARRISLDEGNGALLTPR